MPRDYYTYVILQIPAYKMLKIKSKLLCCKLQVHGCSTSYSRAFFSYGYSSTSFELHFYSVVTDLFNMVTRRIWMRWDFTGRIISGSINEGSHSQVNKISITTLFKFGGIHLFFSLPLSSMWDILFFWDLLTLCLCYLSVVFFLRKPISPIFRRKSVSLYIYTTPLRWHW